MRIFSVNGSPNNAGFNVAALEIAAAALERRSAEAERLAREIETRKPRAWGDRLSFALDRWVVRRWVLQRSPEETTFVRERWSEKGYLGR